MTVKSLTAKNVAKSKIKNNSHSVFIVKHTNKFSWTAFFLVVVKTYHQIITSHMNNQQIVTGVCHCQPFDLNLFDFRMKVFLWLKLFAKKLITIDSFFCLNFFIWKVFYGNLNYLSWKMILSKLFQICSFSFEWV